MSMADKYKLLGSSKSKIKKLKSGKDVTNYKVSDVVLVNLSVMAMKQK